MYADGRRYSRFHVYQAHPASAIDRRRETALPIGVNLSYSNRQFSRPPATARG
ncbi:hypothetical protein Osc7112_5531 [Oscillatoria nigro-viridis PCC 7112]|uniref:Uncharacterized protein n=1 Tax=Phormidium nigroviride PCC 7112 TaxID=179408 RepID=K9VNT0_9CYAN|nr:hypothetical protein Osc7112_5531 [Oscillatoria nigro-viridis PCC 7112]